MIIKLSNCEVKIKDQLTWGDSERIQSVYIKGAKVGKEGLQEFDASVVSEAKYTLLEISVLEIKEGEEVKKFSREWMNNLSISDGNKLYQEVEELNKKKD
jgi:fido (protein-threonine AMPylation protein)